MNKLKNKLKSSLLKQAFGIEDLIVAAIRPAIISKIPNIIHGQRNLMLNMAFPQWHQKKRLSESIVRAINQNWNRLSPVLKDIVKEAIDIYNSQSGGYQDDQRQMSVDPNLQRSQQQGYNYNYSTNRYRDQRDYDSPYGGYDDYRQMSVQPKHGDNYSTNRYRDQRQYDPNDVYDKENEYFLDDLDMPYDK